MTASRLVAGPVQLAHARRVLVAAHHGEAGALHRARLEGAQARGPEGGPRHVGAGHAEVVQLDVVGGVDLERRRVRAEQPGQVQVGQQRVRGPRERAREAARRGRVAGGGEEHGREPRLLEPPRHARVPGLAAQDPHPRHDARLGGAVRCGSAPGTAPRPRAGGPGRAAARRCAAARRTAAGGCRCRWRRGSARGLPAARPRAPASAGRAARGGRVSPTSMPSPFRVQVSSECTASRGLRLRTVMNASNASRSSRPAREQAGVTRHEPRRERGHAQRPDRERGDVEPLPREQRAESAAPEIEPQHLPLPEAQPRPPAARELAGSSDAARSSAGRRACPASAARSPSQRSRMPSSKSSSELSRTS